VAALVISASLLVPLVVFGGTALANGFAALAQYGHGPGSAQYQYNGKVKVTICHATHSAKNPFVTIVVSPQGAANHLKHHARDKAGACATTHSSAARDNDHRKGKDQGQAKGKQAHDQAKTDHANTKSADKSKEDHGNGRDDDNDDDKGGGQGNNGSNGKGHNP
jgi:hypothetical protein